MATGENTPAAAPQAKSVAAIDVGANAIRMVIAEVLPDGRVEVLERLQRAVRLGQDSFRRGRLGGETMRAAIAVLRDFGQVLKLYRVERVRAVATSAVREASNADTFLDRVFLATGIHVEVIGTPEESRLTVSAVRRALGSASATDEELTLVVDVGGGSTLLSLLRSGEIETAQSLRLGSIRLQELLLTSEESPDRSAELLRQHIANGLATVQGSLPLAEVRRLVALGGDARFAAHQVGEPTASEDLYTLKRSAFEKLVRRCQRYTPEELAKRHGLPFAEAETLIPALLVYQILWQQTAVEEMFVSHVSMRDGLLLDLARDVTGQEDEAVLKGVIHSATAIARKYRIDLGHARSVADLAVAMFDQLQADHGLGTRHRLLLRVAGLLHEVGGFVSNRSHHKHSYYLIANSEIFGLNREETQLVAHIARYHRRSPPRASHLEYMSLPRESRVIVSKLAAILRVADALARGRIRRFNDVRFERRDDDWIIYVPGLSDLLLEERAMATKGDLFEDIYGMKIHLEEA